MEIIQLNNNNLPEVIAKAVEFLQKEELVVYPTETCYGVGVDCTAQRAVDKLLKYKSKRANKPLSIAVCDKKMAEEYAILNETAHNIFDHFLPGPITVVSKGRNKVAKGVQTLAGTLGIRIPDYPLVLEIVKTFGRPITATSANVSYKKTPYSIEDILKNISRRQKELLGLIIDAGTLPKRKPSTVIDTTLEGIHILREGDIVLKDCRAFLSHSEEETREFAGTIFQALQDFIGKQLIVFELYGNLGAGKTYFTKFLTAYLNVQELVVSPTFTLCNEYHGIYGEKDISIYHIDAYRMYEPSEMDDLGSDIIFSENHIVFIEWAGKVSQYIRPYTKNAVLVKLHFIHVSPTQRRIEYSISH